MTTFFSKSTVIWRRLAEVTAPWPNVSIDTFGGLLVNSVACAASRRSSRVCAPSVWGVVCVRASVCGKRERKKEREREPTSATYSYLSSSLLKEVAALGGDVAGLVSDPVAIRLQERLARR